MDSAVMWLLLFGVLFCILGATFFVGKMCGIHECTKILEAEGAAMIENAIRDASKPH